MRLLELGVPAALGAQLEQLLSDLRQAIQVLLLFVLHLVEDQTEVLAVLKFAAVVLRLESYFLENVYTRANSGNCFLYVLESESRVSTRKKAPLL